MSKTKNLGTFELSVLAAILHLGERAYGVTILDEIKARTGRTVSVGALYATLARLEKKALITSRLGEATAERGGRAKKYVSLTQEGRSVFASSVSALSRMLDGLGPISQEVSR